MYDVIAASKGKSLIQTELLLPKKSMVDGHGEASDAEGIVGLHLI